MSGVQMLRSSVISESPPRNGAAVESKGKLMAPGLIERILTTADLDGVLEIEAESFNNPTTREWYERELERPEVCFIYVLRMPAVRVAAFCAFWRVADQAHINNLAVRPELRSRGLGSQMLEAIVLEAQRLGAGSLTLEVRRSNTAAQRLYRRADFH